MREFTSRKRIQWKGVIAKRRRGKPLQKGFPLRRKNIMKIRKGDTVVITAGKDKTKQGKVEEVFPQKETVLIPGLNLYKKHLKKRDDKNPGGIIDISRPVPTGNIAVICPNCKKPTRIGIDIKGKEKIRFCKKCEKPI